MPLALERLAAELTADDRALRPGQVSDPPSQETTTCAGPPNSVLANLYRDGRDSMGWHSDDEAAFGADPIIWSVSLGATRRFSFRHRSTKVRVDVDLPHGSLLVMSGQCQRHWHHAVPKTTRQVGPRVNLTFRRMVSDDATRRRGSIRPS